NCDPANKKTRLTNAPALLHSFYVTGGLRCFFAPFVAIYSRAACGQVRRFLHRNRDVAPKPRCRIGTRNLLMVKVLSVLLASLIVSTPATADIFKCSRDGKTVYQNFPCSVDSIGSAATATAPQEQPVSSAAVPAKPKAANAQ